MNKKVKYVSITSLFWIALIVIAIVINAIAGLSKPIDPWVQDPTVRVAGHILVLPFDVSEQCTQHGTGVLFRCSLTIDEIQERLEEVENIITEKKTYLTRPAIKIVITDGEGRYLYLITQEEDCFILHEDVYWELVQ